MWYCAHVRGGGMLFMVGGVDDGHRERGMHLSCCVRVLGPWYAECSASSAYTTLPPLPFLNVFLYSGTSIELAMPSGPLMKHPASSRSARSTCRIRSSKTEDPLHHLRIDSKPYTFVDTVFEPYRVCLYELGRHCSMASHIGPGINSGLSRKR
jgi:hypothetical protein